MWRRACCRACAGAQQHVGAKGRGQLRRPASVEEERPRASRWQQQRHRCNQKWASRRRAQPTLRRGGRHGGRDGPRAAARGGSEGTTDWEVGSFGRSKNPSGRRSKRTVGRTASTASGRERSARDVRRRRRLMRRRLHRADQSRVAAGAASRACPTPRRDASAGGIARRRAQRA
jgi:hypothetical protein